MSSPSDPVDTTCTSCAAWESIFMMEPLPNCFSICARAACRALALPSSITFPSLTIGLSLILNVAADAGAASTSHVDRRNRNKKTAFLVAPSRQPSRGASPLERAAETAVDLDFYTVPEEMQAPQENQGVASGLKRNGGEANRNAAGTEGLREPFEAPGDRSAAGFAPAVVGDPVVEDAVPVARDCSVAAVRAVGAAALGVVHVACIHVAQAVPQRDIARPRQGRGGRGRHIGHLVVGM